MHILPRLPPLSATERQLTFGPELPLANDINGSVSGPPTGDANYSRQANHCSLPANCCSFTAAGCSSAVRFPVSAQRRRRVSPLR